MRKDLNIGEAARRLGMETDTLRRLEREGLIRARRTAGGHRRFTEEAIAQYRRENSGRTRGLAPPNRLAVSRTASTVQAVDLIPEDAYVLGGSADEPDFDQPARFSQSASRGPSTPKRTVPTHEEQSRLNRIKENALQWIPWDVPDSWKAKIVVEMEGFVTPTQFPPYLSSCEASRIASARIEEVIAPFRAQQATDKARKAAEEKAEWRLIELRRHGTNYANRETMKWEWSEQWAARQAATKELAVKIRADMSERDVERMVDDVLSDWEEEEDGHA